MPNGPTDIFPVPTATLLGYFREVEPTRHAGADVDRAPLRAADAVGALQAYPEREVLVEEQYREYYILRVPWWIVVDESSPVFAGLRAFHDELRGA